MTPMIRLPMDGKWTRGRLLGRGFSGSVYEAHSDNGFRFAVKEVSDEVRNTRKCVDQLQQEIVLLSQLNHKNIVQCYGSYQDESRLCMCMELVPNGSLRSVYQKNPLSDLLVSKYTKDILHGLKYLHYEKVVHRDIKCANILVDAKGTAKLADFGVAKIIIMNDIRSCHGTPFWTAPEVFTANTIDKGYGRQADIWSLGCTVLEMLTSQFPYPDLEPQQAAFKIMKGEVPTIPDSLPVDAQDFIQKCLQVNPKNRPTAAQLLEHRFVKVNPNIRPAPANIYYSSALHFDGKKHHNNCYSSSGLKRPMRQAIFGKEYPHQHGVGSILLEKPHVTSTLRKSV